jgi:hypothetical protein
LSSTCQRKRNPCQPMPKKAVFENPNSTWSIHCINSKASPVKLRSAWTPLFHMRVLGARTRYLADACHIVRLPTMLTKWRKYSTCKLFTSTMHSIARRCEKDKLLSTSTHELFHNPLFYKKKYFYILPQTKFSTQTRWCLLNLSKL